MDQYEAFVAEFEKQGMYPEFRTITSGVNEPICTIDGKPYLLFCSNNYLGMTQNEEVKKATIEAVGKYGVGPGGSRVVSGNTDITMDLERSIAKLTGTEDCLTFPTGYMANVAIFRAMMDPLVMNYPNKSEDGVIFSDELNHGSIIDGCKLSKARKIIFKHNSLEDLEKKLKDNDLPNKLIVTEGVFSLDGEITNVPEYIDLARKYHAKLMIDDAHGIGVLGKRGGGTCDHHSCAKDVDIIMGCMDKSLGGCGGFLCGKKGLIKYLRIASRSSLLSSAISTSVAGGMIKAIELIMESDELRANLGIRAANIREDLTRLGFRICGNDSLPAIPLYIGDEKKGIEFVERLYKRGIFTALFRWPAIPMNESRLRITIMATHTDKQISTLINELAAVGRELRVI